MMHGFAMRVGYVVRKTWKRSLFVDKMALLDKRCLQNVLPFKKNV